MSIMLQKRETTNHRIMVAQEFALKNCKDRLTEMEQEAMF